MPRRVVLVSSIALIFCLAVAVRAYAETKIIVLKIGDPFMIVNGERQEIDPGRGTKPVAVNGRTLLPIRTIIEVIGGTVNWDPAVQQVTISANEKTIVLTIGSINAEIKEQNSLSGTSKTLDVAPQSINGRTMVPLRFVTETLGAVVNWDAANQTVTATFGADSPGKPDTHAGSQWSTTHGQTGRQNVNTCTGCHYDDANKKFFTPSTKDEIADYARANSFCYNCHLKRPASHGSSWMAIHTSAARSKGLLNCFTCHDKNEPGANVTGTYCNTCHWFQS